MIRSFALMACAIAPAVTAQTIEIDFSDLSAGEIVTNQYAALGVTIAATNPNESFDIAAIFDTGATGTADPDLEGPPWAGGNLAISATQVALGNALIIATDDTDADGDGLLDNPNDEGDRPAGTLEFTLGFVATALGFDVVDLEGVVSETSSIDFSLNGSVVRSINFTDFTDAGSSVFDGSIEFGNNHANRINPIEIAGGFNSYTINIGGSAAFDTFVIVPAPASASLMLGLGAFAARRRR